MTTTSPPRSTPERRTRFWPFPVLAVLTILVPPLVGGTPVIGAKVSVVVRAVLSQPVAESVPLILPLAKAALLLAAVIGLRGRHWAARTTLGYYVVALVVVALFQNTAVLPQGLTFLIGNAIGQLAVAGLCVGALVRSPQTIAPLRRGRLWATPLMLLAWAYPYAVVDGIVRPSLATVLSNGSGVTYCMITPVVLGVMFLRPSPYPRLVRVASSALATVFGLLNMVTWFIISPVNWWMGVLHVPLLTIGLALGLTSWRERPTPS